MSAPKLARSRALGLPDHSAPVAKPPSFQIVHSLPGRVRVRLGRGHDGSDFAARLALHPAIKQTRWVPQVRSLTASYDPSVSFADIVRGLPDSGAPPPVPSDPPALPLWRQFMLPTLCVAAGFSGFGVR
jgi:hypothetical protein